MATVSEAGWIITDGQTTADSEDAGHVEDKNDVMRGSLVWKLETALEQAQHEVALLKEQLQRKEKEGPLAQVSTSGEKQVMWKIEDFTEKAEEGPIESLAFTINTEEGEYHLQMVLDFFRRNGSWKEGYVSLSIGTLSDANQHRNFPLSMGGTCLRVCGSEKERIVTFHDHECVSTQFVCGPYKFLKMDMNTNTVWTWSEEDRELASDCDEDEPTTDVAEYLEDNTLTIRGTVRITLPEEAHI